MAVAYKVAGNRTYHSANHGTPSAPLEKRYVVRGFWPKYEVGIYGEPERTVIWGRKALKVFEIAMRLEGIKKYRPRPAAK